MSQEPNAGGFVNINGNAATATKLQTPRLINNTKFDGSSDIRITDFAGAVGSDGKRLPTQTVLTNTFNAVHQEIDAVDTSISDTRADFVTLRTKVSDINNGLRRDFDVLNARVNSVILSNKSNFGTLEKDVNTSIDHIQTDVNAVKTNVDVATAKLNAKITNASNTFDEDLVAVKNNATILEGVVDSNYVDVSQRISNLQDTLKQYDKAVGDGQYRTDLIYMKGTYRVNSTGRSIQLNVLCNSAGPNLFLLQINSKSPVPGDQDIVTDICRLSLSNTIANGTMTAIIPPDAWWSVKWEGTYTGDMTVISLQDRNEFKGIKYFSDGRTTFGLDINGSEDAYIEPNWTRL